MFRQDNLRKVRTCCCDFIIFVIIFVYRQIACTCSCTAMRAPATTLRARAVEDGSGGGSGGGRGRGRGSGLKAALSLQQFVGAEAGFALDKHCNTLALVCRDLVAVLAFDTRERLMQWQVASVTCRLHHWNSVSNFNHVDCCDHKKFTF